MRRLVELVHQIWDLFWEEGIGRFLVVFLTFFLRFLVQDRLETGLELGRLVRRCCFGLPDWIWSCLHGLLGIWKEMVDFWWGIGGIGGFRGG